MLVGRAAETDALTAAIDDACAGRGGVVFVVGEAGIGKSRLVQEAAAEAGRRGMRLLRGRSVPGSGATPFRPLAEAFAPVAADPAMEDKDLSRWLPALAALVATLTPSAAGSEITPPTRGEAVIRLLRALCAESSGLLVLEDLHWADPETLDVVEHLTDNLDRAPVLCLVTLRSGEDGAARRLVRRVASRRTARVLELGRLNESQVAAMVHSCTGDADQATVRRITGLAEGVPFLVEEMLVSPGLPASFADTVNDRLQLLSDDDRRVLVTAAAAGRHFDWRLLTAATGLSDEQVADALDRGVAAQLIGVEGDGFRFRHALTADAVFESVSPPRREQLAAAALGALDAGGEPLSGVADLAARLAERAGQGDRAGRLHLAAGEDALQRGALHSAVAALESAVRLLPEGVERNASVERLVEALVAAGRYDEAQAAVRDLAGRLPPDRAAATRLRLTAGALTAARWPAAAEQLAEVRELIGSDGSAALRTELAVREADLALGTNDPDRAQQLAHEAQELARAHGFADLQCEALQLLGRCARRTSLSDAENWFRQALTVADDHDLPVWRLRARHEVGTISLLGNSGVDDLLEARRLAEELGAMATAAILDIEIAAGIFGTDDQDWARQTREHAQRAVRGATELGMDLVAGFGWLHTAGAAYLTGDRKSGDEAAAAARRTVPGNLDIDGLLCAVEAVGEMLADHTGRALDLAVRSAELLRGSQTAPPAQTRAAWPLLLAATGGPDAGDAAREIEAAGVGVNSLARGWLILAQAITAGRTDPPRAAVLARQADDELAAAPAKLWQHLARRYAVAAAATDGWPCPAEWAAEAEEWFRGHGYPAAAAACRSLRGDVGGDEMPATWAGYGVTRREAEVLRLVADGCSNQEIADRLFLSVRTVEKHVESLLRKTSTRSRTQLARLAT